MIEEEFGETQIVLHQRTVQYSETYGDGTSTSQTEGSGTSQSQSESEANSTGKTENISKGKTKSNSLGISISNGETWNHSEGKGESTTRGKTSGWQINSNFSKSGNRSVQSGTSTSYGYEGLWDPFVKSTNEGRNRGKSHGSGWQQGHGRGESGSHNTSKTLNQNTSDSVGGSRTESRSATYGESETDTFSYGETQTLSKTYQSGTSRNHSQSKTTGSSTNNNRTISYSEAEIIHKRPLVTYVEAERWTRQIRDRESPNYPGYTLIKMDSHPFLARRSYYYEDEIFEGLFTPHYAHADKFKPKSQQRLVGGEYTPAHFVPIRLPAAIHQTVVRLDIDLCLDTDAWFDKGEPIFEWTGPQYDDNREILIEAGKPLSAQPQNLSSDAPSGQKDLTIEDRAGAPIISKSQALAPADGKIIDVALTPAFEQDGDIMLARFENPFDERKRKAFELSMFGSMIEYLRHRGATQAEINRMVKALNERYQSEWDAYQDKLKKEADAKAEAARQAEETRLAKEAEEARKAAKIAEERARDQASRAEHERKLEEQEKKRHAHEKEFYGLAKEYGDGFVGIMLTVPAIYILFWTMSAVYYGPNVRSWEVTEVQTFTSRIGYVSSSCSGEAFSKTKHILWDKDRYTYKCDVNLGTNRTHPKSAAHMALGSIFGLALPLCLCWGLYKAYKITRRYGASMHYYCYGFYDDIDESIHRYYKWKFQPAWMFMGVINEQSWQKWHYNLDDIQEAQIIFAAHIYVLGLIFCLIIFDAIVGNAAFKGHDYAALLKLDYAALFRGDFEAVFKGIVGN